LLPTGGKNWQLIPLSLLRYRKLGCFATAINFQPSLIFADTAGAMSLPESGAPESCFTGVGTDLNHKH
jgi:hypothetical protein